MSAEVHGFVCAHPVWLNASSSGKPVLKVSKCALCRKLAEAVDIEAWEKRQRAVKS